MNEVNTSNLPYASVQLMWLTSKPMIQLVFCCVLTSNSWFYTSRLFVPFANYMAFAKQ